MVLHILNRTISEYLKIYFFLIYNFVLIYQSEPVFESSNFSEHRVYITTALHTHLSIQFHSPSQVIVRDDVQKKRQQKMSFLVHTFTMGSCLAIQSSTYGCALSVSMLLINSVNEISLPKVNIKAFEGMRFNLDNIRSRNLRYIKNL